MIKIIVLGSGLIPRGHGIAPCAVPFEADLDLVKLIMKTNGMVPYAVSLRDGHKVRLTCSNIDRIYRMSDFSGEYVATAKKVEPEKPILAPSVPEPKFTSYVEETKPEVKPEPEKKNDNNHGYNNYNNKKNKHNNYNNYSNNYSSNESSSTNEQQPAEETFKPVINPENE